MTNSEPEPGEQMDKDDFESYMKLWKHYEDVAMHFNDLIVRIRIQSIGGIAALATIIGILSKCTSENDSFNYSLAIVGIFCLMLFWIAIWILDLCYYNRLLEGSVNAILELEKNKEAFLENKGIILSSNIEKAFHVKFEHETKKEISIKEGETKKNFIKGRCWFYGMVFAALLILLLSTIYMRYVYYKPAENQSHTSPKTKSVSVDKNISSGFISIVQQYK